MTNVLYLVDRKTYKSKMSRVRFHGIQALGKIATVVWSGPGWQEWDIALSCQENKLRLEHQHKLIFDVVIGYKPLDMKDFADLRCLKCIRYNEMYDHKWTLQEIKQSQADIVICHHHNDYLVYQKLLKSQISQGLGLYHVAHCAEKTIFKNTTPLNKRPVDIVMSGAVSNHYPLRQKFMKAIPLLKDKGWTVYLHKHPGYTHGDAHTDKYQKQLAKVYNTAKIALTCSGRPKSRFGKYVEIPACGTAVAGDLPNEDQAEMKKFVIQLDTSMSVDQIVQRLDKYLQNHQKLANKVAAGLKWASKYTQEHYAKRLLKCLQPHFKSNVSLLWYGEKISNNELLTLRSHLSVGHCVRLYHYNKIKNLPDTVQTHPYFNLVPGAQILAEDEVFQYQTGPGKGSFSAFSNVFRYKLLKQYGCWWADMDMVALKSFKSLEDKDYVFAQEDNGHVASCAIFVKARDSVLMQQCLKHARKHTSTKQQQENLRWGAIGPKLLQQEVIRCGLKQHIAARECFCPVQYKDAHRLTTATDSLDGKRIYGVHLWNEAWRRKGRDKNATYDSNTTYEQLKKRFL